MASWELTREQLLRTPPVDKHGDADKPPAASQAPEPEQAIPAPRQRLRMKSAVHFATSADQPERPPGARVLPLELFKMFWQIYRCPLLLPADLYDLIALVTGPMCKPTRSMQAVSADFA